MKKRNLRRIIDRSDLVGWIAVTLAILWILVDVFNIEIPWLVSYLPQSLLLVLGFLTIYLYGVLESIKTEISKIKEAELLIGNESIYEAGLFEKRELWFRKGGG